MTPTAPDAITDARGIVDVIDHERLTRYAMLSDVETGLALLLIDAMGERPTSDSFTNEYKPRLKRLVGGDARSARLRTEAANDLVYDSIYDLVVGS